MATQNITFRLRGGTAEQWVAANPVLSNREPGLERDGQNTKIKIGDGVTPWIDLPYVEGGIPSEGAFNFSAEHTVSDVWDITHNLGYEPAGVFVTDSGGTEWVGEVEHLSVNRLTITFKSPFGGTVRLS
jgi:hypothetical protein